jgi:hypothetical protein
VVRLAVVVVLVLLARPALVLADPPQAPTTAVPSAPASSSAPGKGNLVNAVMCEDVVNREPLNVAAVFSIAGSKVSCFSLFDPVMERTTIYHNWYYRDELSTKIKLTINPPRWATYSTIQLREADKGPWRVEITDADGNVLQTLRFSITD